MSLDGRLTLYKNPVLLKTSIIIFVINYIEHFINKRGIKQYKGHRYDHAKKIILTARSRSWTDFRIVARLWQLMKKKKIGRGYDALFSGRISTWEALIATERSCLISTLSWSAVGGTPARNDRGATLIWRGSDKPDDWGEKGHSRYILVPLAGEETKEVARRGGKRWAREREGAASRSGYTHGTISAPISWNGRHLKTVLLDEAATTKRS